MSLALFTQAAFGVLGLFLDIKVLSSSGSFGLGGENSSLHGAVLLIFDILLAILAVLAAFIVRQGTPQARIVGLVVGGLGVLMGIIVTLIQSNDLALFVFPQQLAAAVVLILLLEPSGGRAFTQPMPPGGLFSVFSNLGGNKQATPFAQYPQQGGFPPPPPPQQQGGYPQPGADAPQQQGGAYYPGSPQPTQVIPTFGNQQQAPPPPPPPPPPAGGGWQPPQDGQG